MENTYLKKGFEKIKEYACNEFKIIYININMIQKVCVMICFEKSKYNYFIC